MAHWHTKRKYRQVHVTLTLHTAADLESLSIPGATIEQWLDDSPPIIDIEDNDNEDMG